MSCNQLDDPFQSAYRKNHSVETATLRVSNDILQAMDQGLLTALVLLDLSSAFDTVDHDLEFKQLREQGINDLIGSDRILMIGLNRCGLAMQHLDRFPGLSQYHRGLCFDHSCSLYTSYLFETSYPNMVYAIIYTLMIFRYMHPAHLHIMLLTV